jgi:hypothetical protein
MNGHRIVALMAVLLLLALAACGGSKTASAPTTEPAAAPTQASEQAKPTAVPQTSEQAAEPTEAVEPTVAPEPTPAPEEADLSLSDRATGLDQLKSYRVSWKADWENTKDGKTTQASWEWLEEYTSEPEALHYTWKSTEDGADKGSMEIWQIGATMYMLSTDDAGKTQCTPISSSDQESGLEKGAFSPSMLGSLSDARYAGRETVNGIATKHYKYDEKSSGLAGFGKVSGETWVADDGGYVVKDVMNWEGGAGLFGAGTAAGDSGKGKWEWELKDPNGSFTITPPEGCESATSGLPILPDATQKNTMGDLTMYQTATKAADALAFYQKEMAAAGWQQKGEPTSTEGFTGVEFTKGKQTASITISGDGASNQVMINVTQEE